MSKTANAIVINVQFEAGRPSGYACLPMGEIVASDGFITDICWLLEGPEPHGRGWIEREGGTRNVLVKREPPHTRQAYRLRKPNGEIEIVGDTALWNLWMGTQQEP